MLRCLMSSTRVFCCKKDDFFRLNSEENSNLFRKYIWTVSQKLQLSYEIGYFSFLFWLVQEVPAHFHSVHHSCYSPHLIFFECKVICRKVSLLIFSHTFQCSKWFVARNYTDFPHFHSFIEAEQIAKVLFTFYKFRQNNRYFFIWRNFSLKTRKTKRVFYFQTNLSGNLKRDLQTPAEINFFWLFIENWVCSWDLFGFIRLTLN